jgi:hypothetical protein
MAHGHKNCPVAPCRNRSNSANDSRSVLFISAPYPVDSKIHLACAVNNYVVQKTEKRQICVAVQGEKRVGTFLIHGCS